jgi:hypothetical protein
MWIVWNSPLQVQSEHQVAPAPAPAAPQIPTMPHKCSMPDGGMALYPLSFLKRSCFAIACSKYSLLPAKIKQHSHLLAFRCMYKNCYKDKQKTTE